MDLKRLFEVGKQRPISLINDVICRRIHPVLSKSIGTIFMAASNYSCSKGSYKY
jgi:hypothetical protein